MAAVLLAVLPVSLAAQQPAVITGRVTNSAGTPLSGAQVTIQQLGIGAATRGDGSYTILVPEGRVPTGAVTVTARLIGFKVGSAQVALVGGSATADFALADNPLQLGEVVVTGAGTTSEVEKLGSVRDKVSGTDLVASEEPSLVNALSAKAPNVTVTASSGDPGSSAFIQIRGPRSYSQTSSPIFVIDGQPVDNTTYATNNFDALDNEGPITGPSTQSRLSDINPDDIASVEILKGPAASSIYGARAANGAILITTKRGHAGPTRYTLRSSFGGDWPTRYYPLQRQWGQGRFGFAPFGAGSDPCDGENSSATCFRSWGPDVSAGPTYDHARDIFETGFTSDQTLSISGGNERTTFYVSGNNVYQNGFIVGSNDVLRRTTVRLSGTHQASDAIKVSANVSYAKTDGKFVERGNDVSGIGISSFRTPPEFNNLPYLVDGQQRAYLMPFPDPVTDYAQSRVFDNPFFVINEFQDHSSNQRVFGNVGIDVALTNWLKVNEVVGTDYYNDDRLNAAPINSSQFPQGKITAGNITNFNIDHNLTATATYKVNPNLGGTFTLGQNITANTNTLRGTTGRNLITPTPFNLQNTVTRDPIVDQEFKTRTIGYFGQATVDIANQLYLTGAVRYDGSNTFGPSQKYAWFPKASAAWNFIRDRSGAVVSYGKIRASYGEAAVQALPYLAQTVATSTATQPFLNSQVQGVALSSTQNGLGGVFSNFTKGAGELQPERSKEFETGLDIGLFGDKADASFTWYQAQTSNVIINFPLPPSTGFLQVSQNAGKIRNRGIEASLNIRPVTTKDVGWELGFQFARNRNVVLSLGSDLPPDAFIELPGAFLVSSGLQVGQPFGVLRSTGLVKCGISPSGTLPDLDAACAGQPKGTLYIGPDGFPVLDVAQRLIGDPNPKWTGSGRTSIRFKGLTLSALVDVRHGGVVYNGTKGALYSYGTHLDTQVRADCSAERTGGACVGNLKTFGKDFWYFGPVTGPGAGLAVPIGENWYREGPANIFIGNDEDFVEDGGFIRLREVAVQFKLDQPWIRRSLGVSSVDLRVAGRNLLTHTNYTGLDPETNLGQAEQVRRGIDYFNSPQSRSVNFTVTLTR